MRFAKSTALLLLAPFAAGCDGTPGALPTEPTAGGDAVTLSVVLTGPATGLALAASPAMDPGDERGLPISAIESIRVMIDKIDVMPAEGGPWRELEIAGGEGVEVDILNLGDTEILVGTGDLPPGDYRDARLHVGAGALTLAQEVCLGASDAMAESQCLSAGDHEAWFPSGAQSGINTDAHFTIDEGGATEVALVVDPDATVRNATWAPGLGKVIVAPVIRADGGVEDDGEGDEDGGGSDE